MWLSHAITCPFSKYFQILFIIDQIFKYSALFQNFLALFLKNCTHALTFQNIHWHQELWRFLPTGNHRFCKEKWQFQKIVSPKKLWILSCMYSCNCVFIDVMSEFCVCLVCLSIYNQKYLYWKFSIYYSLQIIQTVYWPLGTSKYLPQNFSKILDNNLVTVKNTNK